MNIYIMNWFTDWVNGIASSAVQGATSKLMDLTQSVETAFRSFFGTINAYIYDFIAALYKLFEYVSKANILESSGIVNEIYKKITLILGIFMIFKLSFILIQTLLEPDKLTDKKSGVGSVIVRCIVAVVLLGVTPTIFKEARNLQILLTGANNDDNNILYKLIVGNPEEFDNTYGNIGFEMASDIFFMFYTDKKDPIYESDCNSWNDSTCMNFETVIKNKIIEDKSFLPSVQYLNLAIENKDENEKTHVEYYIEFNWIFSIIFGVIFAWLLINYTLQAGIRVVQLAYLQIVAPIPIFMYISEPDGAFKKWVKQCFATYIDLFIRMMIIYFVMYVIKLLMNQFNGPVNNMFGVEDLSNDSPYFFWVKIIIYLALLLFAKRVPDLLKDLFPGLGAGASGLDFGLLSPKKAYEKYIAGAPIIGKPIGWLGKNAVSLGKKAAKGISHIPGKTLTAIDRKIHGIPKPRGKVGQYFDKVMPGRAEALKNKNQAKADIAAHNEKMAFGQKYANNNISNNFSGEYRKSYDNVKAAKAAAKKADNEYNEINEQYTLALQTGDRSRAESLLPILNSKKQILKDANAQLDKAKKIHDMNKKNPEYKKYAEIEEAVDYYNSYTLKGISSNSSNNNGSTGNGNSQSSGDNPSSGSQRGNGDNSPSEGDGNHVDDSDSGSNTNDNGQSDDISIDAHYLPHVNDYGHNNKENIGLFDRGNYILSLINACNSELADYNRELNDINDSIRGYGSLEDYTDEQVDIINSIQSKQRIITEIIDILKLIIDSCNKIINNGFVNVDRDIEKIKEYIAEKERLEKEL